MGKFQVRSTEEEQVAVRRAKLERLRAGGEAYPNDFRRNALCGDIGDSHAHSSAEDLEDSPESYRVAGRVVAIRAFGRSTFLLIRDETASLQLYADKRTLGAEAYQSVRSLDLGDVIGSEGSLFRTRTGELTLRSSRLRLLVKGLRPLPEKWHGLTDTEARYRRRYLDLIANEDVRELFRRRARIVGGIRRFLEARGFLEVETPMMHQIPGGAAARPFVTHHNALSLDLYLRVAPELYLKRLVVGGFEKVFELNRNFRNEGISTEHNPEFTMCEFYQAYATYEDLMALSEELLAELAREIHGDTSFRCAGGRLDFRAPFARMTMAEAVAANSALSVEEAQDPVVLGRLADDLGLDPATRKPGLGLLADVFEEVAEAKLLAPTFITDFPVEVSPLARGSAEHPGFVDRFELFVGGREIANGFSELNDPEEQHRRFLAQLAERERGDEEAHMMDEDYIEALEYGLPPTAGEGIGVDRLVMVLCDAPSIRDVILFPQLKPRRRTRRGC